MPKITIEPDKVEFAVTIDETILDAGLRNKLNLPHTCKNGTCGTCKTKILAGEVNLDTYNPRTLSEDEQKQGYTLLCKAHAMTDVVLDIPDILNAFPVKILPSKVVAINKINNIAILKLKLPANLTFAFYAGQYIEIMLKGKNRSYSIGSSPTQSQEIELHIKYHPEGVFSQYVWNELQVDSILRFRGPLGNFRLQKTEKPIICVCTGTGFAPIKSILEDMSFHNNQRTIYLYWGNRTAQDFYNLDIIEQWQKKLNIKVVLCLSQEEKSGYFYGYVMSAIVEDFTDLSAYEVYACGNPDMIENVFELACGKLNLAKNNFFSDAFTPSVV